MLITVYDTECNSLDTEHGFIQELAWAKYRVDEILGWRCISSNSAIVRWGTHYQVEPEAEEVTGLSHVYCEEYGKKAYNVFTHFAIDVASSDWVAGQNAILFDRPMVFTNAKRADELNDGMFGLGDLGIINSKPHIDTYFDCAFPKSIKHKTLDYLAMKHGYVLMGAHQAMNDVFATAHVLSKYRLEDMIKSASTPLVKVWINGEYGDPNRKEAMKKVGGFMWDDKKKLYHKTMRKEALARTERDLGFVPAMVEQLFPEAAPDGSPDLMQTEMKV